MPETTSPSPSQPSPQPPSAPEIDRENAFNLYSIFVGSAVRTAAALDCPVELIEALAIEHRWDKKIRPLIELKASSRAGDVERAISSAINFSQANRMRVFLERVLRNMTGMSTRDLEAFLFPQEEEGRGDARRLVRKFSTRPLADLASALEKCHAMTYQALGDTATDRKERKEAGGDDDTSAAEMHMKLAAAMNASGGKAISPRAIVLDTQLAIAQDFARVDLRAPAVPGLPAHEDEGE